MFTNLPLDALGSLSGLILFLKHPALGYAPAEGSRSAVSVIIPARDEAHNLPALLESLKNQTHAPLEVICVDDGSADGTAEVARSRGAAVVSAADKPAAWLGKAWACMRGAEAAAGDTLLFLDADVRLGPEAIAKLLGARRGEGEAVSVQPYHQVERWYEHFSLFFNMVLVAANGVGLPFGSGSIGLFGPVILIGRKSYAAVGGHEPARREVAEDLALGRALRAKGIPYRLFLGGSDIRFRMYSGGPDHLRGGWTKNFASGASMTSLPALLLVFFWIAAGASIVLDLCAFAIRGDAVLACLCASLYALYSWRLSAAGSRLGSFKRISYALYPVWLLGFLFLFAESLLLRRFRKRVYWKGRRIDIGDGPCA